MNDPTASGAASARFNYDVMQCKDFAAVLSGVGDQLPERDIPRVALERGRLLLQARGGAGKTSLLKRLMSSLRDSEIDTRYVTADALLEDVIGEGSRASEEFRQHLGADLSNDDGRPILLLIDGLSEVPDSSGEFITRVIEDLSFSRADLGFVVADRITKRSVSADSWTLLTLTPVSNETIERLLGGAAPPDAIPALTSPYYLDLAHRFHVAPTRSEIQRQTLLAAGVHPTQLDSLARAVATHYALKMNRRVYVDDLAHSGVSPATVAALDKASLLSSEGMLGHHLLCDYLAAHDVARSQGSWDRPTFDALSFQGASLEALIMLNEQVAPIHRDLLLRRVHDWNFYASAYLLVSTATAKQPVSPAMEVVLLAMLAEKRLDRIVASVEDASMLLAAHKGPLASALASASDWGTVRTAVMGLEFREVDWYADWKELFTREPHAYAESGDIERLRSHEGVIGWTASNSLRRLRLRKTHDRAVLRCTRDSDPVVRWRATHVMGTHVHGDNIVALARLAEHDVHAGVRAGSVRSLIEVAALGDSPSRALAFAALTKALLRRAEDTRLLAVLERDLPVSPAPADWSDSAGIVVESLWARAVSVAEQDRWRRLAQRLRDSQTSAHRIQQAPDSFE